MSNDIDCDGTDEAVCPYCGHEHDCSHEFFESNRESTVASCGECGKDFNLSRDFSVTYSSSKRDPA